MFGGDDNKPTYKTGVSKVGGNNNSRSNRSGRSSRNSSSRDMQRHHDDAQRSALEKKSKRESRNREATEDYQLEEEGEDSSYDNEDDGTIQTGDTGSTNARRVRRRWTHPNAHFKQNYAPFSTAFCVVQCIILPVMIWQCGIAPMNINPMIGPYPDALNYWGAKNAVLIIEDGESWRLFTPIFLHAGLIHLAGNVMVQIDAGNTWEKEWGSLVWMIIYIGSAFGSSVFSVCFMPDNISVGSSGAVMVSCMC
jgi:membrane associated rhomboid family serine protease